MRLRVIVTLAMALCLGVGSASAASIGIYADLAGNVCHGTIMPGVNPNLYVLALANGPAAGGITGAECRVDGLPPGWMAFATANSGTALGNIMAGGGNVAFPTCMPGQAPNGMVLCWTVFVIPTTVVGPTYLTVKQHSTTPTLPCPLVTLCDPPAYTPVCVSGGQFTINGGPCTVAVQPSTWSKVKGLYN